MVGHRQAVQNEVVAKHMQRFFRHSYIRRLPPEEVAAAYGRAMWSRRKAAVVDEPKFRSERFTVALATDHSGAYFESITKRATLISDTLLLSHTPSAPFRSLGLQNELTPRVSGRDRCGYNLAAELLSSNISPNYVFDPGDYIHQLPLRQELYGMHCPSLKHLGEWILNAEPLLKAGLSWYLPCYATGIASGVFETVVRLNEEHLGTSQPHPGVDYLIRDRRAVDASGANPLKSRLVRPVLTIELPFVDGVDLRDFSDITTQEFACYAAFRDFLRLTFNDVDDALDDVQSERELVKCGLQIMDGIRAIQSEMVKVKRKRAVAASGAVIGTVGAVLVAVYGPAMQAAIATVGASGGLWGVIHAVTENSVQTLRTNKWYYVWVLARKHNSHVM